MDDALYRLHAEREETYWWWVGKNRIILSLVDRYAASTAGSAHTGTGDPATRRALDIGCGAGGVLARLAKRFDAVGIDMSPIARDYCTKRGLRVLDGTLPDAIPFKEPASFDVIVMSEVVEHVKEDRASIQAVARLLRPGGILLCTVPAHMWLWSSHDDFNMHERRYTRSEFAALFTGLTSAGGEPLVLKPLVVSYYQAASMPLLVGARAVERLRVRVTAHPPTTPEVKPLPGPINWALTKAFEVERCILPHARLPWGTSVISVHQRAPNAGQDAKSRR